MNNFYPPLLEKGDTIGFITPSHCLVDDRCDWVRDGILKIQELGFLVKDRLGNTFVPLGGRGFVDAGRGEWGGFS